MKKKLKKGREKVLIAFYKFGVTHQIGEAVRVFLIASSK
jgi:hypothetical protein